MIKKESKNSQRIMRHKRVRKNISGTSEMPRLNVFRSNTQIYAQIINDETGTTLASSSIEGAKLVGADIAKKAKEANISKVVFDRGGYQYHGRVEALADAARENGLEF